MKSSPASSLVTRSMVETPFPAFLSVKRASFYLGNRRRRKGLFTVGAPWCRAARGHSWLTMGQAAAPCAGRAWAMVWAVEVARGPAAGICPWPAVGVQGAVLATGDALWDKCVSKWTLPAERCLKDS